MFIAVHSEQIIAVKIPPSNGTSGTNVQGEPLVQKVGKDLKITTSDDCIFDEDSGEIRAGKSGTLTVVNEQEIKVCSQQVISGDVDFSTGNIKSLNSVEIGGSVLPGFLVKSRGNLLINKDVRSAKIKTGANLTVKRGIFGKKTTITNGGDCDLNFVEQAKIISKGNIVIRKDAYFSSLHASHDIHSQERSKIIGSTCLAGGSISCGTVGSPEAYPSLLAAAIDPEKYINYITMQHKMEKLESKLVYLLQRFGHQTLITKRKKLEKKIKKLTQKLYSFNLIPGIDSSSLVIERELIGDISVTIHGTIYALNIIRIGNLIHKLEKDKKNVRFSINDCGDGINCQLL